MTNPTPRPALRKAADAEVHPAAPRPARSARAAAAAGEPAPYPRPAPEPSAPQTKPATRTGTSPSASPQPRPRSATTSATKTARSRGPRAVAPAPEAPEKAPRKFRGSTSDHMRPDSEPETKPGNGRDTASSKAATKPDLMKGKSTELDVRVPKALRKAARARAKAEGLDLDTVVIDLLHDWVVERD